MKLYNKITAFFLLFFLLTPLFAQLIHATEDHTYHRYFYDGMDHIQNIENDCAFYHHQINHNAVDLYFNFKIVLFTIPNQDIQIILTKTKQNYITHSASRAPPTSIV